MTADSMFGLIALIAVCIGPTIFLIASYRYSRRWDGVKRDRRNYWEGNQP